MAIPSKEIQPAASIVLSRLWNGTLGEVVEMQLPIVETLPMAWATVTGMLVRSGGLDAARAFLETHPYVEPGVNWQTLSSYSWLAEAAAVLGDRELGETLLPEPRAVRRADVGGRCGRRPGAGGRLPGPGRPVPR